MSSTQDSESWHISEYRFIIHILLHGNFFSCLKQAFRGIKKLHPTTTTTEEDEPNMLRNPEPPQSMIAILIPTFRRYRNLALTTRYLIDKHWKDHPPVYLSGCSDPEDFWLPCKDENASWMDAFMEALAALKERNYSKVYVILDDHPPIRKCHARHLNKTLPEFMDHIGATNIGLRGTGQSTRIPSFAVKQPVKHAACFRNTDPTYKYIFSLHPSLWNLDRLIGIAGKLRENDPEKSHTAWDLEKRTQSLAAIPDDWKNSTYQVVGRKLTRRKLFFHLQTAAKTAIRVLYLYKIPLFDSMWAYYEGPYPIVFAGVMYRGKINHYYKNYTTLFHIEKAYKTLSGA